MRRAGKERRVRIPGVFERGVTQPDGMQRRQDVQVCCTHHTSRPTEAAMRKQRRTFYLGIVGAGDAGGSAGHWPSAGHSSYPEREAQPDRDIRHRHADAAGSDPSDWATKRSSRRKRRLRSNAGRLKGIWPETRPATRTARPRRPAETAPAAPPAMSAATTRSGLTGARPPLESTVGTRRRIITDPPNGRHPPRTERGAARAAERAALFRENTGTAWWTIKRAWMHRVRMTTQKSARSPSGVFLASARPAGRRCCRRSTTTSSGSCRLTTT